MDVTPLQQKPSNLTYILDLQGIVQHSIIHREEGEIIHNLTKEQIVELFELNPDEVVLEEGEIAGESQTLDDVYEGVDEVIVEDASDDETERYMAGNDDLPSFADIFGRHSEEELTRKISEKEKESSTSTSTASNEELRKQWIESYREILKKQKQAPIASYRKLYKVKGHRTKGQVISWAYLHDLNCYAVKREFGIDYFKHPVDFKTLPHFDVNRLAQMRLLYSESHGMATWFENQLYKEFRTKWVNMKP